MTLFQSGVGRYRSELETFTAYFDDLASIPLTGAERAEPCWIHPWLIRLDTVSLYSDVRNSRPARYLDVGSGQSTKVVARAQRDGDTGTGITSIDPRLRSEVDRLCDTVVRRPLEEFDIETILGGLQAGVVVFFDGSHWVLPNSDCVAFFLDVLPALSPGVLVGIHDVYLPDDYPQGLLEMWWSEQYLLAALLVLGAPGIEVALPTYCATGRPELAAVLDPLFGRSGMQDVNRRGSLFWLQIGERAGAGAT